MESVIKRFVVGTGGFVGEASLAKLDANELTHRRDGIFMVGLTDVYVHPLRRRRGWGRKVLKLAVRWADSRRCDVYTYIQPYGPTHLKDGREVSAPDPETLRKLYNEYGFKTSRRDSSVMVRRWSET